MTLKSTFMEAGEMSLDMFCTCWFATLLQHTGGPARTFGSAAYGGYWNILWIYFIAPTVGMLAVAGVFSSARQAVLR
jgi:hypothetical protein